MFFTQSLFRVVPRFPVILLYLISITVLAIHSYTDPCLCINAVNCLPLNISFFLQMFSTKIFPNSLSGCVSVRRDTDSVSIISHTIMIFVTQGLKSIS